MSVIFMHSAHPNKVFKKPKIFSCYVCSNTFTQMSNLRKHLRNIHRVQMNLRRKSTDYICLLCSLTFSRKTNLQRHQVGVHKLDEDNLEYSVRFLCNACTAAFDDQASLRAHRRSKHGDNDLKIDNPYECAECGELFQKKCHLKNHMRYRHLSETDNYQFLRNILPSMTNSVNVIWYSVLDEAQEHFKAKFTMSIKNKAEIEKWINEFQYKNKITLRKRSIHRVIKSNVIYQVKYGCHHNTKPKRNTLHVSAKHTKCPSSMQLKLFALSSDVRNYAEVRIIHTHNHVLNSLEVLKFREPTKEVKKKFRDMFLAGMTPAQALLQHKKDLEQHYGNEYSTIIGDRGICPNKSWVYNYRGTCFKRKDEQIDDDDEDVENETIEISTSTENTNEVGCSMENNSSVADTDSLSNSDSDIVKNYLSDIDFSSINQTVPQVRNIVHIPYPVDISDVPMNGSRVVFSTVPTLRKVHDFPSIRYEADMVSDYSTSSKLEPLKSFIRNKNSENISLDTDFKPKPDITEPTSKSLQIDDEGLISILEDKEDLSAENVMYSNDDDQSSAQLQEEETVIVSAPISEDSSNVQEVLEQFDRMNEMIKEKARQSSFLIEGMQQMVHNFHENLQDLTALSDAMFSFGCE